MKSAHYISIFLLICIWNLFFISCKNNSNKATDAKETPIISQNKPLVEEEYRNYKEWLIYHRKFHSIPDETFDILNGSFEIFERRVSNYVSKNISFSLNFLNEEFTNDLSIGELSIKSLEQIINTQIDILNDDKSARVLERVSLKYPESLFAFPHNSLIRINEAYKAIEESDLKNKEKKHLFQQKITDEILYTYTIECSRQNIFCMF